MSADLDLAQRFHAAIDASFETGDRESVYAFFADDVECPTPRRTLRGLGEIREQLNWGGGKPENLDVEFADGEWQDLGGGHVVRESRMVQRWKETGSEGDGRSRHDHAYRRRPPDSRRKDHALRAHHAAGDSVASLSVGSTHERGEVRAGALLGRLT